ncbi:hypothetical protein AAVH_28366 [Aphelenchoides avenae]|nr:hypothetical protein AAVH_28366 [Aphelenchus avenae]
MTVFRTPKEMAVYRMTVTNTTTWSMILVFHAGVLLRPVFLFPTTVVKVTGPIAALGDFIGGQLQFYIFMVMVVNFLIASLICFSALCMYLVQSRVLGFVDRRQGVGAAVFLHLLATILCILGLAGDDIICSAILQRSIPLCSSFFGLFLTIDYKLKEHALTEFPELRDVIKDFGIFGYVGKEPPEALSIFILVLLVAASLGVLASFAYVLQQTLRKVKKNNARETAKVRWAVVLMLASRTFVPVTMAFLPVMALMITLRLHVANHFALSCALVVTSLSNGCFNCIFTVIVFKPYREALKRMLNPCVRKVPARRKVISIAPTETFFTYRDPPRRQF